VNFMYDGRTYIRRTAGTEIAKYVPTKFAGNDRTDWVALLLAETKRKLDALGRDLAFLSVDVVGSTQNETG
jgi:hypothetical protein